MNGDLDKMAYAPNKEIMSFPFGSLSGDKQSAQCLKLWSAPLSRHPKWTAGVFDMHVVHLSYEVTVRGTKHLQHHADLKWRTR